MLFDVFGTVVDWYGSIVRELRTLAREEGVAGDWGAFALAWRAGYKPAMDRVRNGSSPWLPIDALHRQILDDILPRFGLAHLDDARRAELNRVWHRLRPWPDTVRGLRALRRLAPIATLSNGNVSLLVAMARNASLPWDAIFSAELFQHYKPDPETYLGACALLDLAPSEVMLCAAHPDDLLAARALGLQTAFVWRPREFGPKASAKPGVLPGFTLHADSLIDLARQIAGSYLAMRVGYGVPDPRRDQ